MKVLLATDGSPASAEATRFVRTLSLNNSIDAIIVTVSYDPVNYSVQPWLPEWTEEEGKHTQRILDKAETVLVSTCKSVRKLNGSGATVPFILEQAESLEVDLIVVGAKGHSAIGRVLLGSVSDSIASRAKCSVVVVRPAKDPSQPINKIAIGYDKSVASREAVSELMEWNLNRETNVNVISVALHPYIFVGDGYVGPPITLPLEQLQAISEPMERMASQIAEHFPNTKSQTPVGDHIGDAIVRAAEEDGADLVVVGDTGHSLLGRFLLGSTSKYVLRHAHCSVWISRHHWKSGVTTREAGDAISRDNDAVAAS